MSAIKYYSYLFSYSPGILSQLSDAQPWPALCSVKRQYKIQYKMFCYWYTLTLNLWIMRVWNLSHIKQKHTTMFGIITNVMYSHDAKLNFQQTLLQSSVSYAQQGCIHLIKK